MVNVLSKQQISDLIEDFNAGEKSALALGVKYGVSGNAVKGLLKRRGFVVQGRSDASRQYPINENFLDVLGQAQSYFLGLLAADGCCMPKKNAIVISLVESDEDILLKLTNLIQPLKPLQTVRFSPPSKLQKRMSIVSKRLLEKVLTHGISERKTATLFYPDWLTNDTQRHFVRG